MRKDVSPAKHRQSCNAIVLVSVLAKHIKGITHNTSALSLSLSVSLPIPTSTSAITLQVLPLRINQRAQTARLYSLFAAGHPDDIGTLCIMAHRPPLETLRFPFGATSPNCATPWSRFLMTPCCEKESVWRQWLEIANMNISQSWFVCLNKQSRTLPFIKFVRRIRSFARCGASLLCPRGIMIAGACTRVGLPPSECEQVKWRVIRSTQHTDKDQYPMCKASVKGSSGA